MDLLFDIMIYIKLLLVPVAVIFLIVLFKKVSWIEKILKEWKDKEEK